MDKEILGKVKYCLKKKKSHDEICQYLNLSYEELLNYLKEVSNQKKDRKETKNDTNNFKIKKDANPKSICLVSDIHYGLLNDGEDALQQVYEICKSKEVYEIFCAGDVIDGFYKSPNFYKEHYLTSWRDYVEYLVEHFPNNGITKFYTIAGNHDITLFNKYDINILEEVACQRKDFIYLGETKSNVSYGSVNIVINHGQLKSSTSMDERMTIAYETLSNSDNVDILQLGHVHQKYYKEINGVYIYQCGSLVDQNMQESPQKNSERQCYFLHPEYDINGKLTNIHHESILFNSRDKEEYTRKRKGM